MKCEICNKKIEGDYYEIIRETTQWNEIHIFCMEHGKQFASDFIEKYFNEQITNPFRNHIHIYRKYAKKE